MCYTAIWLDRATNEPYYSQEMGSADRKEAWKQIIKRSNRCHLLALVPGHHGVIFNKQGLTIDNVLH